MITHLVAASPRCGGYLLLVTSAATGPAGDPAKQFAPTGRFAAEAAEIARAITPAPGRLSRQADAVTAAWLRRGAERLCTALLARALQTAAAKPQRVRSPWSRRGRGARAG